MSIPSNSIPDHSKSNRYAFWAAVVGGISTVALLVLMLVSFSEANNNTFVEDLLAAFPEAQAQEVPDDF